MRRSVSRLNILFGFNWSVLNERQELLAASNCLLSNSEPPKILKSILKFFRAIALYLIWNSEPLGIPKQLSEHSFYLQYI